MNNSLVGIVNYPFPSSGTGGRSYHNQLLGLDYESSGHTGFQPKNDTDLQTIDKTTTGAINELLTNITTIQTTYEISVVEFTNQNSVTIPYTKNYITNTTVWANSDENTYELIYPKVENDIMSKILTITFQSQISGYILVQ